jgi:polysaccharide biosynthesis/export protein
MLKAVLALVCAAALCCAQNDAPTSPGTAPVAAPATTAPETAVPNAVAPAAPAKEQLTVTPNPAADVKSSATKAPVSSPGAKPPYVIGPLDVISVKVWNNPNLSSPLDVGPDGMISMPLIGQIKADGLTKEQLKETVADHLKEFLNSPEVDVQVLKVNSKRFFVYGGVGRPGEYPLVEETTIMDALSSVGGFKEFANTKKIYVLRGTQKFNFNYKEVSKGKNLEQNIRILSGDRIFVPE